MNSVHKSASDLASTVHVALTTKGQPCPELHILVELFETLYYTSLKTEEGDSITCHILWLDPNDPNPNPPRRVRYHYWSYIPFVHPLPYNTSTLTKIAKASDPRTSSFTIFPDKTGNLMIWGLVDQGNSYHDMVQYDSDRGFRRPGLFQASITGIGSISAFADSERIADLKISKLLSKSYGVLQAGPVVEKLLPALEILNNVVRKNLAEAEDEIKLDIDEDSLATVNAYNYIGAICRLLLRSQNYKHGGAFLLTSNYSNESLNSKYKIDYPRISQSVVRKSQHTLQEDLIFDYIDRNYLDKNRKNIPTSWYLSRVINEADLQDAEKELDSALWFVSLMSRVDGLVLLTPELTLHGFGVEITTVDVPDHIYFAGDENATIEKLLPFDYHHLGTRHRSMIRYCNYDRNSVGFVISQDGDVRAITWVDNAVVVWENITLRQERYVKHPSDG